MAIALRESSSNDVVDVIAGRYALGDSLGRGGMGRVYRAHDRLLERAVAVKVLYEDAVGDGELRRACAVEARAAGKLGHEGVARVFDGGIDDGRLFVVMELVEGQTLAELLASGATPGIRESVDLAAQVADALDHAHDRGVVHCDVKPANILVTEMGRTKLVDFGIAHAATMTGTLSLGELRGSASYISPEQVRGDEVDGRSDVYALGAVLFELLAGRPPFEGLNVAAVMARRLVTDPPSVRGLNKAVPPALERAVRRALARDPVHRFATGRRAARRCGATSRNHALRLGRARRQHADRLAGAGRQFAARMGAASGAGIGLGLMALSRGLDRAGAGLYESPPHARLARVRALLSAGTRRSGMPMASCLVAAADAVDRAEAVARRASAGVHRAYLKRTRVSIPAAFARDRIHSGSDRDGDPHRWSEDATLTIRLDGRHAAVSHEGAHR